MFTSHCLQIFQYKNQSTTLLSKSKLKKVEDDLFKIDFQKIIGKTGY